MLSVVAPTLSNAAYFEDQTKTWATNTHKVTRHKGAAQTQVSREGIREFLREIAPRAIHLAAVLDPLLGTSAGILGAVQAVSSARTSVERRERTEWR